MGCEEGCSRRHASRRYEAHTEGRNDGSGPQAIIGSSETALGGEESSGSSRIASSRRQKEQGKTGEKSGITGPCVAGKVRAAFIDPMLLLRSSALPEGSEWLRELKFDGYRAIAFKTGGKLHLRSRNNNDFGQRYPAIVRALAKLPHRDAETHPKTPLSRYSQSSPAT